jgi:hypothetical protein
MKYFRTNKKRPYDVIIKYWNRSQLYSVHLQEGVGERKVNTALQLSHLIRVGTVQRGPKLGSFDKSSLKSEARRFLEKSARSLCFESPLIKVTAPSCTTVGFLCTKALSAAFFSLHIAVGNFPMNNLWICSQWHREVFTISMLFFLLATVQWTLYDIRKGSMNAPWCCQRRDDVCSDVGTRANTPQFSYPYV